MRSFSGTSLDTVLGLGPSSRSGEDWCLSRVGENGEDDSGPGALPASESGDGDTGE